MSRLNHRNKKTLDRAGLIYLSLGIALLLVYSVWRFHQARILSFFGSGEEVRGVTLQTEGEIPVWIKSYPLGVDVSVQRSQVKDGIWQVFPDSASYLESSARIGEGGNIIIYGHNKDRILGPIRWAKEGTLFELFDNEGQKYIYEVFKVDIVSPDNLTYILPTSEETLTLYTCTGFLDSKRFVVVAKRK
jgi:LPXTG-site transpeptidase (sortase) family protein